MTHIKTLELNVLSELEHAESINKFKIINCCNKYSESFSENGFLNFIDHIIIKVGLND
jgi:hypothetical protein